MTRARTSGSFCFLFIVLLCLHFGSGSLTGASTSSTLLKHAVKSTTRPVASWTAATAATSLNAGGRRAVGSVAGKRFFGRVVSSASGSVLKSTVASTWSSSRSGIGPRSLNSRSGFRQFSQRATKLQLQLQRSFSWRAVFVDVITNNSDGSPSPARVRDETTTVRAVGQGHHRYQRRPSWRQVGVGTASESASGFVGGYVLAVGSHMARMCASSLQHAVRNAMGATGTTVARTSGRAIGTSQQLLPYADLVHWSQQSYQLHARGMACAVEWATFSAVFGACRYLVQAARGGQDDAWNGVGASTMAGMIFATGPHPQQLFRTCPPQAMMRGAVLYGGTMLLMHPHLWYTPLVQTTTGWWGACNRLDDQAVQGHFAQDAPTEW